MTKGKAWTVEEEKELKKLVLEGVSVAVIAKRFKKEHDAVYQKIHRLGLEVVVNKKKIHLTTTINKPEVQKDLLTPQEALDLLSSSMRRMMRGGLTLLN